MRIFAKKWGNSLGIRIPSEIAKKTGISENSPIELRVEEDHVELHVLPRIKFSLEELVDRITDENRHEETDFGKPQGGEFW